MKVTPTTLLIAIFVLLQFTTNAQSSRLIGKANHVYTGSTYTLQDSTAYFYSGGRGGDLTHPLCFDSSTTWVGNMFKRHHLVTKTYDSAFAAASYYNMITNATAVYWDTTTFAVSDSVKYFLNFTAGTYIQSVSSLHWNSTTSTWGNLWKDSYFYNTNGTVSSIIGQSGISSGWVNVNKRQFTYNSSPNVCQQIDKDFTQGTFYETNDFDYTIRCIYNLASSKLFIWTGTTFTPATTDFVYNYDTTQLLISKAHDTISGSTILYDSISEYSNFTSGGTPQTEIDKKWNGTSFDNVMKYTYTYNSFNQVTSKLAETWTGSAWVTGPTLSYYYYSPYTPLTETEKITNTAEVTLYPNPANNTINLSVKWNEAQPFTIAVYDIIGKLVTTRNIAATSQYKGSIPTGNLPDGHYVVKITGTDGVVAKEIVVAH